MNERWRYVSQIFHRSGSPMVDKPDEKKLFTILFPRYLGFLVGITKRSRLAVALCLLQRDWVSSWNVRRSYVRAKWWRKKGDLHFEPANMFVNIASAFIRKEKTIRHVYRSLVRGKELIRKKERKNPEYSVISEYYCSNGYNRLAIR